MTLAHAPVSSESVVLPVVASSDAANAVNFMAAGYDLIQEPLNLWERGRAWYTAVAERQIAPGGAGLVLGVTQWIVELLQKKMDKVIVVDSSPVMLERCARAAAIDASVAPARVETVLANWMMMPPTEQVSAILSDNSFSFLSFPTEWELLCDVLAERMPSGGRLLMRVLSVPDEHRCRSVAAIVDEYRDRETINYTEVRARLLFAHWNPETSAIATEDVLDTFEANRQTFAPLLDRCPTAENDLATVAKYRGAGAVYSAPPIEKALSVIRRRFQVHEVHFGSYGLAEYFPLIVAVRR